MVAGPVVASVRLVTRCAPVKDPVAGMAAVFATAWIGKALESGG
jgi:hypothetical protein